MSERLAAIAQALGEGAPFWRSRPFVEEPSWARTHPEIAAWCERLDPAETLAGERDDRLPPHAPASLLGWQERLDALTALPCPAGVTPRAARRVPERKALQVAAFIESLPGSAGAARVLDWCGGKGHLGRALGARLGLPVTVLEREARYAAEAHDLAARDGVALSFMAGDALDAPRDLFGSDLVAVGLHACGELGTRLLERAAHDGASLVALAPCCLHRVAGVRSHGFVPLSAAGKAADPHLDHASLRLATADEVVARASLKTSRQRENAFRLGFDLLLREAGRGAYTPLGTLPSELVRADFATFARGVSARLGIALPARWDPGAAERAGWLRAERARAFGLVRGLFKRAIELWCALDRASFLAEHGLHAEVRCFADRTTTPRNLLIVATPRS